MLKIKEEIQSMYNYLTGNSYDEFELDQMSNRELRDLHADLWARYDEDMTDNRSMFFE